MAVVMELRLQKETWNAGRATTPPPNKDTKDSVSSLYSESIARSNMSSQSWTRFVDCATIQSGGWRSLPESSGDASRDFSTFNLEIFFVLYNQVSS
jgi:hypothetical protein